MNNDLYGVPIKITGETRNIGVDGDIVLSRQIDAVIDPAPIVPAGDPWGPIIDQILCLPLSAATHRAVAFCVDQRNNNWAMPQDVASSVDGGITLDFYDPKYPSPQLIVSVIFGKDGQKRVIVQYDHKTIIA